MRATSRPRHYNKAKDTAEGTAEAAGVAVGLFLMLGVPLVALLTKGDEQVVPAGTIEVVYLNGPLRVNRKSAVELQPAPSSGYAYVYVGPQISVRNVFCGQTLLNDSREALQLELNPATYWFSTGDRKGQPARIEVAANREYYIGKNRRGLFAKEFQGTKGPSYRGLGVVNKDLTKLTPEEYRSLTAEPVSSGSASGGQRH
ncbi:MAG: hypothetical protein ACLPVW_08435 [Terriglobales bacterium]